VKIVELVLGVIDGVGFGVDVCVEVVVGVGVKVGVSVVVGVGVSVGVFVGVSVGVSVVVGVGVSVGVFVGVSVVVGVGVGVNPALTINVIEPDDQPYIYVPGVSPKLFIVELIYVIVPLSCVFDT
jgi:hypothetical protein